MRSRIVVLLCLAALSACDDGPDESFSTALVTRDQTYARGYLTKGITLAALNAPFPGVPAQALQDLVALPPSYDGARLRIAPEHAAFLADEVRIVVAFNLRAPAPPEDLCAAGAVHPDLAPLNPDGISADLALCRGSLALASGSVLGKTEARAGTPEFAAAALDTLMTAVFGSLQERRALGDG